MTDKETVHAVDDDGIKHPFTQQAAWRGGAAYTGGGGQIVITGTPLVQRGDDGESTHNCDALGCGRDHVVWRFRLPLTEEIQAGLDDYNAKLEGYIASAGTTVGCHWCDEQTPREGLEAIGAHLRTCPKSPLVAELAAVTAERDDLKRTIALSVGLSA